MNKIEKLIKELCPNGVEWKKLGEVCVRNKGMNITASQMEEMNTSDGTIRIFAAGNTIADVVDEDVPEDKIIRTQSIIVKSRGYIGFSYYEKPFTHKNEMWSYSAKTDCCIKYIYYFLSSKIAIFQAKAKANSVKLPQLCVGDTDDYKIPLPPLPIQTEIDRILDKFVEQQEQLERLIELRKKQYEYYREEMLKPKEGEVWETKRLGEIASKLASGATPTGGEDSYKSTGISLIRSQNVLDFNMSFVGLAHIDESQAEKLKNVEVKENDLLLNITGDSVARICKVDSSILPARVNQHIMVIRLTNSVDCNYILYSLIQAKNKLLQCAESNGGSRKALNKKNVSDFIVNIPSLSKQKEIAEFLDSFESSIATLTSALEASKRRYEYYRDKMMRF